MTTLKVAVFANPHQLEVGDTWTYTATVHNLGTWQAENLTLDLMPTGVGEALGTVHAASGGGSCTGDLTQGNVVCGIGTLPPGESSSFQVSMLATEEGHHTLMVRYQVNRTPMFVVADRWITHPDLVGSNPKDVLQVLNALVSMEIQGM